MAQKLTNPTVFLRDWTERCPVRLNRTPSPHPNNPYGVSQVIAFEIGMLAPQHIGCLFLFD